MKAKIIILLLISAVVTLSFTVTSHKGDKTKQAAATTTSESVGGLALEDPIK